MLWGEGGEARSAGTMARPRRELREAAQEEDEDEEEEDAIAGVCEAPPHRKTMAKQVNK